MNRLTSVVIFLFLSVSAFAQQDPQFTQNMFNQMFINPGYGGSNEAICATGIHRQQWAGFDGYPVSTIFELNAPLNLKSIPSGVGIVFLSDILGSEKNFGAKASYAYKLDLGSGKLGLGLSLGIVNKALDVSEFKSPNDLLGGPKDPSIPMASESKTGFDLGFGAYFKTNNLQLGLSATHLTQPTMSYTDAANPYWRRHYYLTAGYVYQPKSNPLFAIIPSLIVKSDGSSTQFDINACVLYNKMVWGGVTYRAGDAFAVLLGVELRNGLKVGYSIDIVTSKIGSYNRLSHEIMVGYCFNLKIDKKRGSYKSVRFL